MATIPMARTVDPQKLNLFLQQAVGDMGAALHAGVVLLGDRLGLYRAMRNGEPVTSQQLSQRTGVRERYVREWLRANAASKYVDYDPGTDTYQLNPEQAFALDEQDTAIDLPGFYYMLAACMRDEEKLAEAFREGRGFGWHEHDKGLFVGCERFFRPTYLVHLVAEWIPALAGVEAKLKSGARVADIGCGHGASTMLMAKAYPSPSLSALTTMTGPSRMRAKRQSADNWRSGCASMSQPQLHFPAPATTSSPASTACTIWVTRSAPRGMCGGRWLRMVRG